MGSRARISAFALAIAVLLGVFLASGYERGAAQRLSADEREAPLADREGDIGEDTSSLRQDASSIPCAVALDSITSFISASTAPLVAPGGWLHLKEQIDHEGLQFGAFPDGRPIPEDIVFDQWYFMGKDGLATQAITVTYDVDGNQVQVSLFDGRTWENPTFGIRYPGDPFPLALDGGLRAAIRQGEISGCQHARGTRAGQPTVEFSIWTDFPRGLSLVGYPERLSRITSRGVFGGQMNALPVFEILYTSVGGQERLVSSATVLVAERVASPPDDLLRLLREVSR